MDSKNIWKYQGAIIAFLILFLFIVPIPKLAGLAFLWIIVLLLIHMLSGCWFFSFFMASTFVIILFVFLLMKSRNENIEFRKAFIENFAENKPKVDDDDEDEEVDAGKLPMLVGDMEKTQDKITEVINKPNIQELSAIVQKVPEKKISMMEKDENLEDDVFGKLDIDADEESDEDTEEDEKELEKKAGKTSVSSKNAYKAQKQLYDLTVAVNKLHDNMEKIAPTLKKGQKIIESMSKLGLNIT